MTTTKTNGERREFSGAVEGGGRSYQVEFAIAEPITAEVWCQWWEQRAVYTGNDPVKEKVPGTVMRAKYLAYLDAVILDGRYYPAGKPDEAKALNEAKMNAPVEVVQWVNLHADNRLAELWNVPQPSSGQRQKQGSK